MFPCWETELSPFIFSWLLDRIWTAKVSKPGTVPMSVGHTCQRAGCPSLPFVRSRPVCPRIDRITLGNRCDDWGNHFFFQRRRGKKSSHSRCPASPPSRATASPNGSRAPRSTLTVASLKPPLPLTSRPPALDRFSSCPPIRSTTAKP